ncbi:MAG: tetratricopeptide repeat protein [bacterium]|nr:tetratricopeptide repeat protein [bacterium]
MTDSPNPSSFSQAIDPAFRERCTQVFEQWTNGTLPFKMAIDTLLHLEGEAAAESHFANQGAAENSLGMVYGYRGDYDNSIRHFARARDLFERANLPQRIVTSVMNIGESYRQKGDFGRARQMFRAAFDQARALGAHDIAANSAANEGDMLLSLAQFDQARERFQSALELADAAPEARSRLQIIAQAHQGLATCHLHDGDPNRAWQHAQHSLAAAREADKNLLLGAAFRTLGEVVTVLGQRPDDSLPDMPAQAPQAATNEQMGDPDMFFQLSIETFQKMNAEGEIARTTYVQAISLARRGQRTSAARRFQEATRMFTKLGMRDDAKKASQAQMDMIANP